MFYFFLYTLIVCFCKIVYAKESLTGWNYLNIHCRNNDNQPVDWWFMYKAPNENIPNYDFGRNFTFLTPDSEKRWSSSDKHITEGNLLFNTLSPLYRPTYSSYLGFAVYEDKNPLDKSTSAHGILMADQMGGVWITHTVPGLVDLGLDRPRFPVPEMPNGHLLACVSLDLLTMNDIAMTLKRAEPGFTRVQVPARMRPLLPDWLDLQKPVARMRRAPSASIQFVTKSKLLYGSLMSRAPGEKHCLYRKFARQRKIVLDVYGNTNATVNSFCRSNFGVRQIEAISVKLPEAVHYVNRRSNDYARFAVSTAAHWQRTGAGKPQYWTCVSNLPMADASGKGGMLLCIDDYDVWNSFDNFKVQEPTCNAVKKFHNNDVSVN